MIARKWNYKTHKYDDYVLPQGACLVDDDLGKHINCAVCGQEIILGNSYTSLEIHTNCGFGYCVCGKCYKKRNTAQGQTRQGKYEILWCRQRIRGLR